MELRKVAASWTIGCTESQADIDQVVEQKRAETELEGLRVTKVTAAVVDRESAQQKADADLYT